jgi:hypothetical protein
MPTFSSGAPQPRRTGAAPSSDEASAELGIYLVPGTEPLSERELRSLTIQVADLVGCEPAELRSTPSELGQIREVEAELGWVPEGEACRERYLALLVLLRNRVHLGSERLKVLVQDADLRFSALEYLDGLREISPQPVLLGLCRRRETGGHREILVRRVQ